jgi:primase-polymerase (primpol)-like protein
LAKKNLCKEADVTPKPQTFNGDLVHLPEALVPLTTEQRWVVWSWEWRGKNGAGKWTKPPYQAKYPRRSAKSNDPSTWGSYTDAVAAVTAGHADGIGYMLLDDHLGAADVDHCADLQAAAPDAWAQALIDEAHAVNAYVLDRSFFAFSLC